MKRLITRIAGGAMLVAMLLLLGLALPQQEAEAYVDVNQHWARDAINRWDALGALEDFTGNYFSPNQPITRAEFFSLLVRAFDAQQAADIRQFTDVPADTWYYEIIAKANRMGIANGTSETTMAPLQNISRQDAATVMARALGLSNQNISYLAQYHDNANIADYAKTFVSAMTQHNYMNGTDTGFFYPRNSMSRGEAVTMINNVLTHYYRPEVGFDSFVVSGNVMTVRTESVFNDLTINGDLILCDGVDDGVVSLNNCTINGRLLIRGGGTDSVVLNNTYVRDGIVVINYSYDTHIVTTGGTEVETMTAYSGFHLDGTGVHNVVVSDEAATDAKITLTGVILDSMEVGGLGANLKMTDGRIINLLFTGDAAGAKLELGAEAYVSYFSTVAPNVTVTGKGRIGHAFINAPGANLATAPDTYTISANLTAIIDKEVVSGSSLDTNNNVARSNSYLAVTRDGSDYIGGDGIVINTTQGRTTNTVLVTQKAYSTIPLDYVDSRDGYFIGFFIPSPVGSNRDYIPLVTYTNSDGKLTVMKDVSLTQRDNVYGLEFFIPVTKDAVRNRGRLNETLYIEWNSYISENILFHSGWLDLEPLSNSDEEMLVDQFRDAHFRGLDGTRYYDEEALCRLLASDNPLGLDVSGFNAFDWEDQMDIATILYQFVNEFTSKQNIQDRLDQVLAGKGALYAVNSALTVPQMRNALENRIFAKELDIDVSASSAYGKLSENGKERVARLMLLNRKKDYANEKAVKTAFDKYVSETKALETTLLVQINTAVSPEAIQKLIETKKNYELLDFDPTTDPYKSYTKPLKFGLSQLIYDLRPYESLDEVIEIIRNYLANTDPDGGDPRDDDEVTSFSVKPTSLVLAKTQEVPVEITVVTPTGTHHDASLTSWVSDKPDVASVVVRDGIAYVQAGNPREASSTATITFTSTQSTSKKGKSAKITVRVIEPVHATSVKLKKNYVVIAQGGDAWLEATVIPSNSTDILSWSTGNPSIASIDSGSGQARGINPGFSTVTVRAAHTVSEVGVSDTGLIAVLGPDPGVMIYPETATIGINETRQLYAEVSPHDASNRTVIWKSSNDDIVSVDGVGRITGISGGEAIITVTSVLYPDQSAEARITVDPNARGIVLNKKELTLYPSGQEQLTYQVLPGYSDEAVVWGVIQNGNHVSVVDGLVTGIAPGSATVVVSLVDDPSVVATCEVEVLEGAPKITVNPTEVTLPVGDNILLDVTFSPANINRTITWTSDNENIATVDENGRITAISTDGRPSYEVKIYGVPQADTSQRLEVKVLVTLVPVNSFTVAQKEIYIDVGTDYLISQVVDIKILPENAPQAVTWSSDDVRLTIRSSAESADKHGGQRLIGETTTYYWRILDEFPWQEYVSDPVTMVGRVNDGISVHDVTVLVHIRENDTTLKSLKINESKWVYEVGTEHRFKDVLYNIYSRNPDGSWNTEGNQPPTQQVEWTLIDNDGVARMDGDTFVPLKPGSVTIRARVGNLYDDLLVYVVNPAVQSVAFSPLITNGNYPAHIQLPQGETRTDLRAVPSPNSEAELVWYAYLWDYANATDFIGSRGIYDSNRDYLNLASDGSSITATATQPGFAQVSVQPKDPYKMENISINNLYARFANAPDQKINGITFWQCIEDNGIAYSSGEYRAPNEYNLNYNGTDWSQFINQSLAIDLKVPYEIAEDKSSFLVWITEPELKSISLDYRWTENSNGPLFVTATVDSPNATVTIPGDISWQFDTEKLERVSSSSNAATGEVTVQFQVKANATGTAKVEVSTTNQPEQGFRDRINGQVLMKPSVTVTDSLDINLDLDALSAPASLTIDPPIEPETTPIIETPPIVAPDPDPEPEGNPYINEEWYIPNPGEETGNSSGNTSGGNTLDPGHNPGESSDTGSGATTTPEVPTPVEPEQPQVVTPTPPTASSSASVRLGGSSAALIALARERGIPTNAATYESYDTSVALVDSSGVVTGVGSGSTTVVARYNGQEAAVSISVEYGGAAASESKSLKFRSSSAGVSVGESITLQAYLATSGYSFSDITWSSSKPEVATVQRGVVTGLAAGKTTITASVDGTKLRATCTVTVAATPKTPVVGISLNNTSLALDEGKSSSLKVTFAPASPTWKGLNWFSLDPSVATVDASGKVTAVAAGATTIIVVSDDGGYSAACTVTVSRVPVKVSKITLSEKSLTLAVGGTATLTYTITPDNADNQAVTWTSSKEDVATVVNGQIVALKPGSTTITVTTADGGKRATCKVTVKK